MPTDSLSENVVDDGKWDPESPQILASREVADTQEIIELHLGPYDIPACDIWRVEFIVHRTRLGIRQTS